jgi:hypothetical protein
MCHFRHRAHDNPFAWPGLTDITAHVDFTAMAEAGERAGLDVAGFAAQAPFLVGNGILDALAAVGPPESLAYIAAAAPVQKLLAPAEMGDSSGARAGANAAIAWPGFPSPIAGTAVSDGAPRTPSRGTLMDTPIATNALVMGSLLTRHAHPTAPTR